MAKKVAAPVEKCETCAYKSPDAVEFRAHSCTEVLAAQWVYRRVNLMEQLDRDLNRFNGELLKFRDDLAQDPLYAMGWSDSAFVAAAKRQVVVETQMLFKQFERENLTPAQQFARVQKYMAEHAMRGARYPSMSTSVPQNLAKVYLNSAYAEMAEKLDVGSFGF